MNNTPLSARYRPVILPAEPDGSQLQALVEPYQAIITTQFQAILARTEASSTYPWIDTKINLLTGQDYPADDPLFGRDLVSGWVQGRGLESIVRFAAWLAPYAGDPEVAALILRSRRLAEALLARLAEARQANGGHVHFYMTPAGRAFVFESTGSRRYLSLTASSPYNYSDLFAAKGSYLAANYLGDPEALTEARAYCHAVYEDIVARSFTSDQPAAPTLARPWVAEAFAEGPAMIAQGLARWFLAHEPGDTAARMAVTLARYVWDTHVNVGGKWPELHDLDLTEYVDAAGRPYRDDGKIVEDPGHALEYAGLFLMQYAAALRHGGLTTAQEHALAEVAERMPAFLLRQFANGFRPDLGGIYKTIDLLTRQPLDATLPWWSLPETIRAGLGCWRLAAGADERQACLRVVAQCHNAFVQHYVRPEVHLMAIKLRAPDGRPLDIMAVYPDVDPGYHTALSLMDALDLIQGQMSFTRAG